MNNREIHGLEVFCTEDFRFHMPLSIHHFFTPSTVPHVSRMQQKTMLTFDDFVALIYLVHIVKILF